MNNRLLPPNATDPELALEASTARLSDVPVTLRDLWNPDTCPADLLPWLAWSLSIDAWKSYWPEDVKRELIRRALDIQRHKGTTKAVRDVVESYGGSVELREWFQQTPRGVPHTFDLWLTVSGADGQEATADFVNDVIADVSRAKPVRSHFTFTQGLNLLATAGVVAVARPCVYLRLALQADAANDPVLASVEGGPILTVEGDYIEVING